MKLPSAESVSARPVRIGGEYRPPPLRDYDDDARLLQRALIDKVERASLRVNLTYLLVTVAVIAATFYPWSHT